MRKSDENKSAQNSEIIYKNFKLASTYIMRGKTVLVDECGIFNILPTKKKINANNVSFGGKYPYVARGEGGNGIRGYIDFDEQYLNPGNTIAFGQDTATMNYQSVPYFTGDKIQIFELNTRYGILKEDIALYLIAAVRKAFAHFSWGQQSFALDVISYMDIALPVDSAGNLDLQYMQDRIAELEQDRIAELEAYLVASGLDDYELTDEDKELLSLSIKCTSDEDGTVETDCQNGQVRFKKYLLGDLFESSTGDVDLQQKDINGRGQFFVNSGVDNRGIKGRTDRKAKIFPSNTITIDFWGNAYYRDFEYKMATHNHVFSLSGDVIKNRLVGLYIVSKLSKLPTLFSYNNMATWNKLKLLEISLPVNSNEEIDFDYMERYIRAIEKLAIADVVKYKNQVIATTKQVVAQQ